MHVEIGRVTATELVDGTLKGAFTVTPENEDAFLAVKKAQKSGKTIVLSVLSEETPRETQARKLAKFIAQVVEVNFDTALKEELERQAGDLRATVVCDTESAVLAGKTIDTPVEAAI